MLARVRGAKTLLIHLRSGSSSTPEDGEARQNRAEQRGEDSGCQASIRPQRGPVNAGEPPSRGESPSQQPQGALGAEAYRIAT